MEDLYAFVFGGATLVAVVTVFHFISALQDDLADLFGPAHPHPSHFRWQGLHTRKLLREAVWIEVTPNQ